MSVEGPGRIARFVAAARTLLVLQLVAAALAVAIAAWAFFEVRGLAAERDQLKARVAELEARPAAPIGPVGPAVPLGPDPLLNQATPYDLPPDLNMAPPPVIAPDVNTLVPPPAEEPAANRADPREPEPGGPARRWDCSGANAQLPRCRPLMERPNLPLNSLEPRGAPLGTRPGGNQQGTD